VPSVSNGGSDYDESETELQLACHGNRVVDIMCLQRLLDTCAVCHVCTTGRLRIAEISRIGLASEVAVSCNNTECERE